MPLKAAPTPNGQSAGPPDKKAQVLRERYFRALEEARKAKEAYAAVSDTEGDDTKKSASAASSPVERTDVPMDEDHDDEPQTKGARSPTPPPPTPPATAAPDESARPLSAFEKFLRANIGVPSIFACSSKQPAASAFPPLPKTTSAMPSPTREERTMPAPIDTPASPSPPRKPSPPDHRRAALNVATLSSPPESKDSTSPSPIEQQSFRPATQLAPLPPPRSSNADNGNSRLPLLAAAAASVEASSSSSCRYEPYPGRGMFASAYGSTKREHTVDPKGKQCTVTALYDKIVRPHTGASSSSSSNGRGPAAYLASLLCAGESVMPAPIASVDEEKKGLLLDMDVDSPPLTASSTRTVGLLSVPSSRAMSVSPTPQKIPLFQCNPGVAEGGVNEDPIKEIERLDQSFKGLKHAFIFDPASLDFSAAVWPENADEKVKLPVCARNLTVHAYDHALQKLLARLDGVPAVRCRDVREARKKAVLAVRDEMSALEDKVQGAAREWRRRNPSSPAPVTS